MDKSLEMKKLTQDDLSNDQMLIDQGQLIRIHIGSAITSVDIIQHSDEEAKKKYDFLPELIEKLRKYALALNIWRLGKLSDQDKENLWHEIESVQKEIQPLLKKVKTVEGN